MNYSLSANVAKFEAKGQNAALIADTKHSGKTLEYYLEHYPASDAERRECLTLLRSGWALLGMADADQDMVCRTLLQQERELRQESSIVASPPPQPLPRDIGTDVAYVEVADLAAAFAVPKEKLRKRLDRWRLAASVGWKEKSDRGPRESKYLYQLNAVKPIIDALKASLQSES